MKAKYNIMLSLLFLGLFLFELIVHKDIITEPYMVALCIFLGGVCLYNFGSAFFKYFDED